MKKSRKLVLSRETVHSLTDQEMDKAAGGSWFYTCATCGCGTVVTCNDDC